jgi:hypothetical protein
MESELFFCRSRAGHQEEEEEKGQRQGKGKRKGTWTYHVVVRSECIFCKERRITRDICYPA